MANLITCLCFDQGEASKAADFYAATFPDSHVDRVNVALGDFPGGHEGSELTVEFTLLGRRFIGLNGGPNFTPNESVSFMAMGQRSVAAGMTVTSVLSGIMIPSSRTTSEAPH